MDLWDLDAIELVGPTLMHVRTDGHGQFGFIAVQGQLDWKPDPGSTSERIAFTWEGNDEGERVSGRGWASVDSADHLIGHIYFHLYFHLGDDSGFRAAREPEASWHQRTRTNKPSHLPKHGSPQKAWCIAACLTITVSYTA
jgi:hypothetical protein